MTSAASGMALVALAGLISTRLGKVQAETCSFSLVQAAILSPYIDKEM